MRVRALTVVPGMAGSARLEEREPPGPPGGVPLDVVAVGVCGTDREILAGAHGAPPPGTDRLVLGHESVARVTGEGADSLAPGDWVVGIVRRPDPVPCPNCAVGEWDMCRNGGYRERGIEGLDGFLADRVRLDPAYAVQVPSSLGERAVLVEPASILAKAWEHVAAIGSRARWEPATVLVTGAGPIGLLAALMGRRRGLEVRVFDRVTTGPKPGLVEELGATYHVGEVSAAAVDADIVIECTGVASIVFDVMRRTARNGIVCLTGVTSHTRSLAVPAGEISRDLVLENDVVFGSVNANRRHYETAVDELVAADQGWLDRMVTRRVPLSEWERALQPSGDDVKVVVVP